MQAPGRLRMPCTPRGREAPASPWTARWPPAVSTPPPVVQTSHADRRVLTGVGRGSQVGRVPFPVASVQVRGAIGPKPRGDGAAWTLPPHPLHPGHPPGQRLSRLRDKDAGNQERQSPRAGVVRSSGRSESRARPPCLPVSDGGSPPIPSSGRAVWGHLPSVRSVCF